ncbi:heterogeneous nuclear ribonucleoprotein Q-like isoform X2 [Anthonomus grandis grandis]|uniref:heterogeneous nuclear ribonucleoprotein Q-like isoform X2 n=1 Tax=Anthonomus grandis grandis TaxID=2921223 RepID=UPI0021667509|nr:heterogeneous nuclear ribonucleoprotein Q-like isoform X2 [Anthonomus grandis grandis]
MAEFYCYEESHYRIKVFSHLKNVGYVPQKGSEIFISGIPREATIRDLQNFLEPVGPFFEIKLMMKPDGVYNRGFGYVTYMNKPLADKAIEELKCKLFLHTTYLNLQKSVNNCRIFVSGLPIDKSKDEIWNELKHTYDINNIVDVIIYRNFSNPTFNRGFAFLEFPTHEQASWFRAKFWDKLFLFGKQLMVDWARPNSAESDSDCVVTNKTKIISLRNLEVTVENRDLANFIYSLIEPTHVEKIFKYNNYAYIHLTTRKYAEELMDILTDFYKDTSVEVRFGKQFNDRPSREKPCLDRQSKPQACPPTENISRGPSEYRSSSLSASSVSSSISTPENTDTLLSLLSLNTIQVMSTQNTLQQLAKNREDLEKKLMKKDSSLSLSNSENFRPFIPEVQTSPDTHNHTPSFTGQASPMLTDGLPRLTQTLSTPIQVVPSEPNYVPLVYPRPQYPNIYSPSLLMVPQPVCPIPIMPQVQPAQSFDWFSDPRWAEWQKMVDELVGSN